MHKIIKNYQAKILNGITMIVPRVIRQDRQIQCITSFFFFLFMGSVCITICCSLRRLWPIGLRWSLVLQLLWTVCAPIFYYMIVFRLQNIQIFVVVNKNVVLLYIGFYSTFVFSCDVLNYIFTSLFKMLYYKMGY